MAEIIAPEIGDLITSDGVPNEIFNNWLADVTDKLNSLQQTYQGEGSPEGVVVANPNSFYINTLVPALYLKQTGTDNTGWVLI